MILKVAVYGLLMAVGTFIVYATIIDQPDLAMRAICGALGAGLVIAALALCFNK